jgi:hypothetical protein
VQTGPGWVFAHALFTRKFILRRSVGEKPILFKTPINNEVSADFCLSVRYAAMYAAAISTRN